MNYIFSYGSLINKQSLADTISDNPYKASTMTIKDFERGWRNHVHHENRTGLGIIDKTGSQVNGVILEVDEKYLHDIDKREYGFVRREIKSVMVDGTLWAYFVKNPEVPTAEYPIALTYVDTVLVGCLTHGRQFTIDFLKSTVNWEYPFVNDRDNPLFPRREKLSPTQIEIIDKYLEEFLPEQYAGLFND